MNNRLDRTRERENKEKKKGKRGCEGLELGCDLEQPGPSFITLRVWFRLFVIPQIRNSINFCIVYCLAYSIPASFPPPIVHSLSICCHGFPFQQLLFPIYNLLPIFIYFSRISYSLPSWLGAPVPNKAIWHLVLQPILDEQSKSQTLLVVIEISLVFGNYDHCT